MLKNTIILLTGIAGTGKKTIGEAITSQDNSFRMAHHHAWIDPILKLFGNDPSAVWWSLDERGWDALNQARNVILNTIANVCPEESNFVITYEMLANNPYHQAFFDDVYETAKKRHAKLIPVRLICELDELLRRVGQQNRADFYKTQDKKLIKTRFANEKVFFSHIPHELTLDVTNLAPNESAKQIIQWATTIQNQASESCNGK